MKKITAILVDDELFNLKGLHQKIEKLFPNINILGSYQQPEKAIEAINLQAPDILFLDIQMPRINGFELLSKIKIVHFQVIFITAYSEYAIEAFKKSAVGYILKPLDNVELSTVVNKAIENITQKQENEKNLNLIDLLSNTFTKTNKLIIPTTKGISFINQNDILYLEGYNGYTKIHTTDLKTQISSYNLGKFTHQLNSFFYKCHKSYIINLSFVKHFENEGYVIINEDTRIPISKVHRKDFLSLISEI